MKVTRADLLWNYGATFMRVASAVIILPLILRMLPAQEVGLWSVMIGLNSFIYLLDFGFFQTFSRAITYTFSGAQKLERRGFNPVDEGAPINYPLVKGVIGAMSRFYAIAALLLALLFLTGGSWYIDRLLIGFEGEVASAKLAWYLYGLLLTYQFYTYYYDAALVGRGMIMESRRIIVFSQTIHIIISATLLWNGVGILSMVIGQSCATVVNRFLARRAFYDEETRSALKGVGGESWLTIIKTLFYTAWRNGMAGLSWIFTNRMLALFGALYIPLELMGSYGISKQVADITVTLSSVWFVTHLPKLTGEQLKEGRDEVKKIYLSSQLITVALFLLVTPLLLLLGNPLLSFIGSSTYLISTPLLLLLFGASLLEALTSLSTSVLMSRNEVPHYLAQAITALIATLLLFISLREFSAGLLSLILIPMVVQLFYQHWRWSWQVMSSLKVRVGDYWRVITSLFK